MKRSALCPETIPTIARQNPAHVCQRPALGFVAVLSVVCQVPQPLKNRPPFPSHTGQRDPVLSVSAVLSPGRSRRRSRCTPPRWWFHRPDSVSEPTGGHSESFCERFDGIDASLAAVLNRGDRGRTAFGHPGKVGARVAPFGADAAQPFPHPIAGCCAVSAGFAESVRKPGRRHSERSRKFSDGADGRDLSTSFNIESGGLRNASPCG